MRCSKFSLIWMGYNIYDLRQLRKKSIGASGRSPSIVTGKETKQIITNLRLHPKLEKKDMSMLIQYINDMRKAFIEVSRVLKPGGRAIYVVGDNTIRGTHIKNSTIFFELAKLSGLKLCGRKYRALPTNRRYLPPPGKAKSVALDSRMHKEVILFFEKPL